MSATSHRPMPTSPFVTWVEDRRIEREGIAIVCPVDQVHCREAMDEIVSHVPPGRRVEVELRRHWLGLAGAP
jgi:hypothetical protein